MYPRPQPPLLQALAFDVVCTSEETPEVRAQLVVAGDDPPPPRWSGYRFVFREPLMPGGDPPRTVDAKSDDHGQAAVEWRLRKPESTIFQVTHVAPEQERASMPDEGRIFVWPKDAPLLIVDAEEALIAAELDAKASEALLKARKEGWQIVYLAPATAQAHDFRKARRWISEKQAKLPIGPVLCRPQFATEQTIDDARRELLKSLQARFKGPLVAIVKSAEAAGVCKDAGVKTVMVGAGPAPAGVTHAPSWADLKLSVK
jgi:hypothetical protein